MSVKQASNTQDYRDRRKDIWHWTGAWLLAIVVVLAPLPEVVRAVLGSLIFLALLTKLAGSAARAARTSRLEPEGWLRTWTVPPIETGAVVIALLLVARLL
jgi:uncharacterized membrane protein